MLVEWENICKVEPLKPKKPFHDAQKCASFCFYTYGYGLKKTRTKRKMHFLWPCRFLSAQQNGGLPHYPKTSANSATNSL